MKAREKHTGKEITILGISKEWGTATYIEDGILRQKNLSGEWEIIDESESVDWSYLRREAAKDILAGMMAHQRITYGSNYATLAKYAIAYADELIRLLKENSNA